MDQELILEATQLQRHLNELEQHHEFLVKQSLELEEFANSLSSISGINNKKILSSLGKGVYMKTSVEDPLLFVEVGAGIVIKKTPEELNEIVQGQLSKLKESEIYLTSQIGVYFERLQAIVSEIELQRKTI